MYIKEEDIIGYELNAGDSRNTEIVCLECITTEEQKQDFTADMILTEDDRNDETMIFCDRCKKQL